MAHSDEIGNLSLGISVPVKLRQFSMAYSVEGCYDDSCYDYPERMRRKSMLCFQEREPIPMRSLPQPTPSHIKQIRVEKVPQLHSGGEQLLKPHKKVLPSMSATELKPLTLTDHFYTD